MLRILSIYKTRRFIHTFENMATEIEHTDLDIMEPLANVTLEGQDKTQVNDGQVLVSKGSGKLKVRKGQTEEEFQEQKEQFRQGGPVLNTLTWLEEVDITKVDHTKKSDRLQLENLAQRLYYKREYDRCLEVSELGLKLFADIPKKRIQNEWNELEYMKNSCLKKLEM